MPKGMAYKKTIIIKQLPPGFLTETTAKVWDVLHGRIQSPCVSNAMQRSRRCMTSGS
jgi:hypothetical protein